MNADVQVSAASSQANEPCSGAWKAHLVLEFSARAKHTYLSKRYHLGPIRVQKALWPEPCGNICHVIIVHPPAGVAGGDEIDIDVHCHAQSHALITTPGAGKLYKSDGRVAKTRTHLQVEKDAFLEWLPQELMLYDQAIAETETFIELDEAASFIGWEMLVIGRQARQERFNQGRYQNLIRIRIGSQLALYDRLNVIGNDLWLASPLGLNGHAVTATLWALAPLACRSAQQMDAHINMIRDLLMRMDLPVVISRIDRLLVARYMGHSNQDCLDAFAAIRAKLRQIWFGLDEFYPRIWRT